MFSSRQSLHTSSNGCLFAVTFLIHTVISVQQNAMWTEFLKT